MKKIAILVFAMVLLCASSRESQADEQNYFMEIGLGVMIMPEYNNLLNDIYADQRDGFAIDYKLSLQQKIIKGLTIGPKVDLALLATEYGPRGRVNSKNVLSVGNGQVDRKLRHNNRFRCGY